MEEKKKTEAREKAALDDELLDKVTGGEGPDNSSCPSGGQHEWIEIDARAHCYRSAKCGRIVFMP